MTLETIYYVGQTIAVLLILGSLVAIYVQQRKDHELARAESQREILQKSSELLDGLVATPTAVESLQVCVRDYHSATPKQKTMFTHFIMKHVLLAEQSTYMHQDRLIHVTSHPKFIALAALYLGTPGGLQYWRDSKVLYGTDVVDELDAHMKVNPTPFEEVLKILPFLRVEEDGGSKVSDGQGSPGQPLDEGSG